MAYGVSFRVAPGMRVYRTTGGGFFAFFMALSTIGLSLRLFFLTIQLAVIAALIVGSTVAFVVYIIVGCVKAKRRFEQLQARAIDPRSVTVAGQHTRPRTWGVYRVPCFKAGGRTVQFSFGNHPVRRQELIHEFGHAELLGLFPTRADAEEYKYMLVSGAIRLPDMA